MLRGSGILPYREQRILTAVIKQVACPATQYPTNGRLDVFAWLPAKWAAEYKGCHQKPASLL